MSKRLLNKLNYWKKKHGSITNLIRVAAIKIWRTLINNRQVLFYFDCNAGKLLTPRSADYCSIKSYKSFDEIPKNDLNKWFSYKEEYSMRDLMKKNFRRGATLWLVKYNNQLAGFRWSIKKGFDGFYMIPMTQDDIIFFSAEIFPEFRGKGISPAMLYHMITNYIKEKAGRIFIGMKVWNKANLRSVPKVGFKKIGTVRTIKISGKIITIWSHRELKG